MTMKNVTGVADLRERLQEVAQVARERRLRVDQDGEMLARERQHLSQVREDVVIGAAAVVQSIEDEEYELDGREVLLREERYQLDNVLGRRPAATAEESAPPATSPPVHPDPARPGFLIPEEPVVDDTPAEKRVVVERITVRQFVAGWGIIGWLLAVIGAFIGFLIGMSTHGFVAGGLADLSGGWYDLFAVLWVIAWMALGFFGGGLLGAYIGAYFVDRRQHRSYY